VSNRVHVTQPSGGPRLVDLPEAASLLRLSEDGVEALVGAGYLIPSREESGAPRFAIGDLKAFVARNADDGAGALFGEGGDAVDPKTLLAALDGRSEEMARRAFDADRTEGRLGVRASAPGEALEGRPGELPTGTLVIADERRPVRWLPDGVRFLREVVVRLAREDVQ